MPFTKAGKDDYTSPSGRHFNSAQVRLYYANGGKFPGQKSDNYAKGVTVMKKHIPSQPAPSGGERPPPYSKGDEPQEMDYAKGGPVLGRVRDFIKEPDAFRTGRGAGARQDYGTKGGNKGADKSLKAVKPRG